MCTSMSAQRAQRKPRRRASGPQAITSTPVVQGAHSQQADSWLDKGEELNRRDDDLLRILIKVSSFFPQASKQKTLPFLSASPASHSTRPFRIPIKPPPVLSLAGATGLLIINFTALHRCQGLFSSATPLLSSPLSINPPSTPWRHCLARHETSTTHS